MNEMTPPVLLAFQARDDLAGYGVDALLLFALQLRFSIEDIDLVATTSLTEGSDDKKADLVYIDSENGHVVIAQAYYALKRIGKDGQLKKEAPRDKASDLNTAISWLLARPIDEVPIHLRPHAEELRQALQDNAIRIIQFWYVHNLPESQNVREELRTVEHIANAAIKANYQGCDITEIQALEVGISTLDSWYQSISTPILVTKEFTIPIPGGFTISDSNWQAYVTSVQATWLYEQYRTYGTDMLSANVREYLGSRNIDRNINNGIKQTAQNDPEHFWVFNNGITALVHSFKEISQKQTKFLNFTGISIVNGAQTIGAIGNLASKPSDSAMVQVRFITCSNPETVYDIVRFNNSQNKIAAPDFRSTDPIQRRLAEEFREIPNIDYIARRGGFADVIKRQPDTIQLHSVTAGQALAAFHGDPDVAYHQKTHMWEDDTLYSTYFNEQTKATHTLFAYSLLKSVEHKKMGLIIKSKADKLIKAEESQLEFFRLRGAAFLITSAIAKCLEVILNKPIPNLFVLSFKGNLSLDEATEKWVPIVTAASAFCNSLKDGLADGFKTPEKVDEAMSAFEAMILATKDANNTIYSDFAGQVN